MLLSTSGGKMTPFLTTKTSETNGQISPDGKWVAYASNESGDLGDLCHHLSHRSRQVAGLPRRRHRASLARRWQGDFLHRRQEHVDRSSGQYATEPSPQATPRRCFSTQFRAQVSSTDRSRMT